MIATMSRHNNTVDGFTKFLAEFSTKTPPVNDFFPLRFLTRDLTTEEMKGEILDAAFTSVEEYDCPDALKYAIAKEVLKQMEEEGYDKFRFVEEEKEWQKKGNQFRIFYYLPDVVKAAILHTYNIGKKWNEKLPDIEIPKLGSYSVCGIKNTRRKMEDRHVTFPDLNQYLELENDIPPTQYYAVFDGHGGVEGSDFAARQLHLRLVEHESFKTDLTDAIVKSIKALDEEYCEKCKRDCLRSGSTAVVAGIRDNTLHLAWLGDSQAAIVKSGQHMPLMEPHKPEREDEKKRIEDLGGCVIWFGAWRVNGSLSVSRSIGDSDYKPLVSGDADKNTVHLDGTEEYICIACDGFWDVLNGDQLVKLVSRHMRETNDKSTVAEVLCEKARQARSNDNITVIVVFLKDEITLVDDDDIDVTKLVVTDKTPPEERKDDTNDDDDEEEEDQDDTKDESNVDDNSNQTDSDQQQKDSVMVQGNKLQPTEKEQPPLKLFVNKPKTVSSSVNVLKTDSTPHARLPCSIVGRKPLRISNRFPRERVDTTGTITSLSTTRSDESTVALSLYGSENQLSVGYHQTHHGFPAILSNRTRRSTPSPCSLSEPELDEFAWFPAKPPSKRRGSYRRAYHASVITAKPAGFKKIVSDKWQKPTLIRRASRSVPDGLNELGNTKSTSLASNPFFFHPKSENRSKMQRRYLDESYMENKMFLQNLHANVAVDSDIAITNSLPSKIKPKQDMEKRLISSYLRHPTASDPILWQARQRHTRW